MLTEIRGDVAAKLNEAGVRAVEYVGETITPPCAAVVPAQPYMRWPTPGSRDIPFGHVNVGIDVLLVSHRESNKKAAVLVDRMIEDAVGALSPHYDLTRVSQPGRVELSGAKFIGAVITIEHTTEEP